MKLSSSKIKKYVIFILVACTMLGMFLLNTKHERVVEYSIYQASGKNSVELTYNEPIYQKFKSTKDFDILTISPMETKSFENYDINYEISYKGKQVLLGTVNISSVSANESINITLPQRLKSNKKYTLTIATQSKDTIIFKANQKNQIALSVKSVKNNNLTKLTKFVTLVLLIYCLILFYFLLFKKISTNKLFIVSVFVLGTIITTLLPVGNVPDEANAHISTAYHYSNVILGVKDTDSTNVKIRKCDEGVFNYIYVNSEVMEKYLEDFQTVKASDESMVSSHYPVLQTKLYSFTYYFSALGITLGRLLHLNGIICLLLGRFFNFGIFLGVIYYCVNHIKSFKEIIYFICLLPITLQQVCSLSYDSIVFALSFLIITLTINLYHDKKLSRKDLILLCVSCVLIAPCKSFAYSPLLLAPLSYLITKFNWKKLKEYMNRKSICLLLIVFILLAFVSMLICRKMFSPGSIMYLFGHPFLLLRVLYNTLGNQLYNYLLMMIASMGLLHINIYAPLNIFYYMYLMYVVVKMKSDFKLPLYARIVFIVIFLISSFGILLGIYSWSYSLGFMDLVSSFTILGFQSRYIIPLLSPLMMAIVYNDRDCDDLLDRKIIGISSLLDIFVVISMMYF